MSEIDDQLNRLLRAAAKSDRAPADATPPLGFATRVLAEARSAASDSSDANYALLCQRAVLCSFGITALVFLLSIPSLTSFRQLNTWHSADIRLVDSAMDLQIP